MYLEQQQQKKSFSFSLSPNLEISYVKASSVALELNDYKLNEAEKWSSERVLQQKRIKQREGKSPHCASSSKTSLRFNLN